MYKVHAKIDGPKTNFPLLGDGYPVPAVLLDNYDASGLTFELLASYGGPNAGITYSYHLPAYSSQLVEISNTHIVSIPNGASVVTLSQ